MTEKIVTIYQVHGRMEAELIKTFLEAHDIPTGLAQESAGITYGLTFGSLGKVDILVPEKYERSARELMEEYEKGINTPADDLEGEK
jgi:hypothetical protein